MIKSCVKAHRDRLNLSQSELAEMLGTTVNTIANWEHGRSGAIHFERVALLCKVLNCSPDQLTEEVEVSDD